jgi:ankyrin repeat protein
MRKSKKNNHIGELSQVNELMGYIDRKELSLTDASGKNAFHIACSSHFYTKKGEFGFEDVVKNAIESGIDINIQNVADGKTGLMYALNNKDDYNIVKLLLEAGVDVNITDHKGRIALFDSIKTMKYYDDIVSKTYDINHQDQYGVTALMIAAYQMHFKVIDDLLDRHTNVHLRNAMGQSAYDIAKKYMNRHIRVSTETDMPEEGGKNNNITTSKDVLEDQKHNHSVREMVRKLECYENGEAYVPKKFKRPFFGTKKAR